MSAPQNRRRRSLMSFVLWIGGAYVLICALAYVFQARLVFFPTRDHGGSPADTGLAFEDVWLATEAGERVHAWLVHREEPLATAIFFHGNAGNVSHRRETLAILHGLGLRTLILDYPGYGKSDGSPSEEACYRAARAAGDYVRSVLGAERVVLWGRSLGGAVAAALAAEETPGALILESTFTNLPDMASDAYPWLPARWLARISFGTLARVEQIGCPKLVIHSRDDRLIPFHHAERLADAAATPVELLEISGGHNDGFWTSGNRYRSGIRAFLDRHLGPSER